MMNPFLNKSQRLENLNKALKKLLPVRYRLTSPYYNIFCSVTFLKNYELNNKSWSTGFNYARDMNYPFKKSEVFIGVKNFLHYGEVIESKIKNKILTKLILLNQYRDKFEKYVVRVTDTIYFNKYFE